MRILTVVGARPQFIKAFAVSKKLREQHEEILVHTGQHYDEEMSDVFFDRLGIPEPDHNLGVGSSTHGRQTAEMIRGLEELVEREEPDVLMVYGDTNSTLAGGVVASKMDPILAHVEAGLRSFNREMPEEVNRVLTDHASDLLFAPTEQAVDNLAAEGITEGVHMTGDVMYDAILLAREHPDTELLDELDLRPGEYILATVHRAGNTDDPEKLRAIMGALGDAPYPVVLPAHPRTVKKLEEYGMREEVESEIRLVEPLGYHEFVTLMDNAERIATDSGGVQKEAFFLDTPCVTMREETEWTETVDAGWNTLAGADGDRISEALRREVTLRDKPQPYGDGDAAAKIIEAIENA